MSGERPVAGNRLRPVRLFDDPQADARIRALIPRMALLGCLVYAIAGVLSGGFGGHYLALGGLIAIGVVGTLFIDRFHVLERAPWWVLFGILMAYCLLIAVPVNGLSATRPLDEIFGLLPVFFAAIFFEGWLRYAFAVSAALLKYAVMAAYAGASGAALVERVLGYLVAARLAAEIARVLRDALARNNALHEVLALASSDPAGAELAGRGLTGALRLVGWDLGAAVVAEDETVRVAASRGADRTGLEAAVADPGSPYGALVRSVLASGQPKQAPNGPATALPAGLRVLLGLPIRYRDEVIGVLLAGSSGVRRRVQEEVERLRPIADQLGLALGAVRAYRAEVRLAEELNELNKRKDEFLANVSHELRTPLTSIRLACYLLETAWESLDPATIRSTVTDLERRSTDLTALVESLLDEAVAAAGALRLALTRIEWQPTLARWVQTAEQVSGRPITLAMPTEPVASLGDPAKLERVVANLLLNAVKFSPPDTPICAEFAADEDCVQLEVTDVGIGIAAEELPWIFDRFYQADGSPTRTVGGVGIGLSLVRHFVIAHGGSVSVRSRPGLGSTFTVRLPRESASTPTPVDAATR